MFEQIEHNGQIIAIIIRADYSCEGVNFFTPDEFSQQLAYMRHPEGKTILPHKHNLVTRKIEYTQEILFIKRGKLKVNLYGEHNEYLHSRILSSGDTILLASGGHGFEIIEDLEMIEVKQGPYTGDDDKVQFKPNNKIS
jgi:mannose-6-phosphate isomerase-like protein (cupin superfamily)